mgnify:CR=1 FL=1
MKEVNRETLIAKIKSLQSRGNAEYSIGLTLNEEFQLSAFKMLLTTMDSEPVAWTSEDALAEVYCDETGMIGPKYMVGDVPLYRHVQPAPVVPDERDKTVDADNHPLLWSFNEGWNACRAAMLNQK